jgi:GT2 family glycosyltransferase
LPILHALAVPQNVSQAEIPLYYRGIAAIKTGGFLLTKGNEISFDTYLNSLSIKKWKKYTNATKFLLNLDIYGKIEVNILSLNLSNGNYEKLIIRTEAVTAVERTVLSFSLDEEEPKERVLAAFSLRCISDEAVLYGGTYSAESAEADENKVKLALNICTFKREQYVDNTIQHIWNEIWDNAASQLNGHLRVFIVDNAQTIDSAQYSQFKEVRYYPNRNLGGAGGFTRGMLEIMKDEEKFTHIIVADDDAQLLPTALEKMYSFLLLLKHEFADRMIGGAMLSDTLRYWQSCGSNSRSSKGKTLLGKHSLDMRKPKCVVFNEIEEPTQYNGWWLCCIPVDRIKNNGLPLPLFIHGDDVEYGLRNKKPMINLNGIAMWHPVLGLDYYNPIYEYYDIRNNMYIYMLYNIDMKLMDICKILDESIKSNLAAYRYNSVRLNIKAINDVQRGLKWLVSKDPETLHQEVSLLAHKFMPVTEMPIALDVNKFENSKKPFKESTCSRWKRKLTFNGHLLPSRHTIFTRPRYVHKGLFYRAKRIFSYDEQGQRAFMTKRNLVTSFVLLCSYFKARLLLKIRFDRLRRNMHNDLKEVTTLAIWEKIIGPRSEAQ